jgi:hypothetical protein
VAVVVRPRAGFCPFARAITFTFRLVLALVLALVPGGPEVMAPAHHAAHHSEQQQPHCHAVEHLSLAHYFTPFLGMVINPVAIAEEQETGVCHLFSELPAIARMLTRVSGEIVN